MEGTELICALGINDLTTVNLDNDICTTIINCYLVVEGEAVLDIAGNTLVGNTATLPSTADVKTLVHDNIGHTLT